MRAAVTRGERREAKRRKKRMHRTSGSSVKLLQQIIMEKAEKAMKESRQRASIQRKGRNVLRHQRPSRGQR